MSPSLDIAFIGMKAALDQLERTGAQIAQLVEGSDPVRNAVELITSQRSFEASAAVARTADQTLGTLLDLFA